MQRFFKKVTSLSRQKFVEVLKFISTLHGLSGLRETRVPGSFTLANAVRNVLDRQVLVLNRLWQPVNICSARRAFSLLCLGHAQVVHTDREENFYTHDIDSWLTESERGIGDYEVVHTVSHSYRIPAIIVLGAYDRLPRQEVKFTRQNVFARDNFTCQYCATVFEARNLNLDHVVPRDKGGRTSWENVVCSCIRCNTRKANKLPAEANMFPLKEPRAPKWRPFFSTANKEISRFFHDSWRFFIDPCPSQVTLSN